MALAAVLPALAVLTALFPPGVLRMERETAPPTKIAIFPPVLGLFLALDGGATRVAGASRANLAAVATGIAGNAFPAARALAPLATQAPYSKSPGDPEPLLLASPDAVLCWPRSVEPLRRLGLPARAVPEAGEEEIVRALAGIAGREERGEFLIARSRQAAISQPPPETRPRALITWRDTGGFRVAAGRNPMALALEVAGGENVAAGMPHAPLGVEELLRRDPDVILLPCCGADLPETLYAQPSLHPLKAVRQRRIYLMPPLGEASAEGIVTSELLLVWMRSILYPEAAGSDIAAALRAAYQEAYGYRATEAEIDAITRREANRGSAGFGS
jgi:ABC-type Fe3+-hydroxamate transport system substrate-binding protein